MEGGNPLQAIGRSAATQGIGSAPPSTAGRPGKAPRLVSVPSSSSAPHARSLAAVATDGVVVSLPFGAACSRDEDGWSYAEEESEMDRNLLVFGPAPSKEEVAEAVTSIQQIFSPVTFSRIFEDGSSSSSRDPVVKTPTASGTMYTISSIASQSETIEPNMKLYNIETVDSQKVINAFRSLHINPSIQKMVTSLSSDKAVWNAVMKNAAVKELRESFYGECTKMRKVGSGPVIVETILDWVLEIAKSKILEFFNKIWKIANDTFQHQDTSNVEVFEDTVKSSFMLSVVVFIVVVVIRLFKGQ